MVVKMAVMMKMRSRNSVSRLEWPIYWIQGPRLPLQLSCLGGHDLLDGLLVSQLMMVSDLYLIVCCVNICVFFKCFRMSRTFVGLVCYLLRS